MPRLMVLWKLLSGCIHPSQVPFKAFLFWVASIVKFLLGSALIICVLIILSAMELVRRARLCTPWEGTWHGSQPLLSVRAGVGERTGIGPDGIRSCLGLAAISRGAGARCGERRGVPEGSAKGTGWEEKSGGSADASEGGCGFRVSLSYLNRSLCLSKPHALILLESPNSLLRGVGQAL